MSIYLNLLPESISDLKFGLSLIFLCFVSIFLGYTLHNHKIKADESALYESYFVEQVEIERFLKENSQTKLWKNNVIRKYLRWFFS